MPSPIGYAIVYTGFLKRATPQNIVIGGLPHTAPPLLGWSAVTGMQQAHDWEYALLLVLIISVDAAAFLGLGHFPPRRLCVRWCRCCRSRMVITYTRWQILLYTVLLGGGDGAAVGGTHERRVLSGGALVLGAVFLWYAWKLLDPPDEFFAIFP